MPWWIQRKYDIKVFSSKLKKKTFILNNSIGRKSIFLKVWGFGCKWFYSYEKFSRREAAKLYYYYFVPQWHFVAAPFEPLWILYSFLYNRPLPPIFPRILSNTCSMVSHLCVFWTCCLCNKPEVVFAHFGAGPLLEGLLQVIPAGGTRSKLKKRTRWKGTFRKGNTLK